MHGPVDHATMHRVHLWGTLRDQFLPDYNLRVATVHEATRALASMVKGFGETVAKGSYRVILGDRSTGRLLGEEEVGMVLPPAVDIHIVPAVQGSGRGGGIGKIIAGIVLIVASFIPGVNAAVWGAYAAQGAAFELAAGMALAMSGVTALMSPQARAAQASQQQQNSFAFSGVQNNAQQGVAVPVVYGQFLVGSVVVSTALSTQQLM